MSALPELVADVFRRAHALTPADWDVVGEMYAPDMEFSDPIQTFRGRERFLEMNRHLMRKLEVFRFDDVRAAGDEPYFFVSWAMTMKLPWMPAMRTRGVTEIESVDGVIVRHVDHWDLLGTMMGGFPIAGALYRRIVRVLG